jgi:tripartite-type tricarboxylate transporter receptor subunit TctC
MKSGRYRSTLSMLALVALILAACNGADEEAAVAPEESEQPEESEGADEPFPEREITFIVPFPAGSAPDGTFREITSRVEEELGQTVVLQNREGAGGTVGLAELFDAEPDGYTIGMGSTGPLMVQPHLIDTAYPGPEGFEPILQTNAAPMVLFVNADTGIETIEEYVDAASADPGALRVGLVDQSVLRAEMELLMEQADIEVTVVPYGAGEQVTAVVDGTVESGVAQPAVVMQHEETGSVNIVGVFGTEQPEGLDAPLFQDAGYDIPFIVFETVLAPLGTPPERIEILHDAFRAVLEQDEMVEYFTDRMALPLYLSTEELAQRFEEDAAVYAELAEVMRD